jgi:small subunit ribosomal protein S17e
LGKVRQEHVKQKARELLKLYPDKFTADFQNNKKMVESLVHIYSSRLRNRIAGYITRLLAIKQAQDEEEAEESMEPGE